jgi:hypothetical protein
MATIGILIETEEGNVKETNFGVLTAARGQGDNTIVALMMDGSAEGAKDILRQIRCPESGPGIRGRCRPVCQSGPQGTRIGRRR